MDKYTEGRHLYSGIMKKIKAQESVLDGSESEF